MPKNWVIAQVKSKDVIEQLLINRKIKKSDWDAFLNPNFETGLHDPFLMKGMNEAVERISQAIAKNEIVGVFGDYDADGIPGLALLYDLFSKLGLKVLPYIPSRSEGYGLNKEGIDFFSEEKATLMVTVDLGIRSIDQVIYAKDKGLDVIILDHHEPGEKIPECLVVNPKQAGDKYPFRELSGCGVAFKLAQALSQRYKQISTSFLKWSLDLVAISTICDVVPLIDENRIFAKFGLIVLKKTKRLGLVHLYKAANIDPESIDTYTVGFQIGPRLNAPGRMDHANQSFYLLISNDPKEARQLAVKLDQINRRRQDELERVLKEARKKVLSDRLENKKVIIISGSNWPHGIIGLVAGKLMEEYSRPVIVCEKRENDYRGSARSIDSYNIVQALENSKEYLSTFGGHAKAAGLTIPIGELENLTERLCQIAEQKLNDGDLTPKLKIDLELKTDEIKQGLADQIKNLEPFGLGNPRPVFLLKDAELSDAKLVGKDQNHLKFRVNGFDAIGFGLGEKIHELQKKTKDDIAFTLDENFWNDIKKLQLKIVDIK